ncbi:MAG: diaminopimelate decarboxylase [Candidatus Dadabacteria bacterium]|nr:MAG: diaminopimelate decarboxylase [Candidatus Dadabacteria bacterium]
MNAFEYRNGQLHAEGVPLEAIAEEVGTPCYVYSLAALRAAFDAYRQGFSGAAHLVCYSVKANSNLAVLAALAAEGAGFDVVSAGELARVLRAGGDPAKVVFSGVGKRADEIREALEAGILMFNVESPAELDRIAEVARTLGRRAPVALRVNPDVDPRTHPYIATGLRTSKFGIAIERALEDYARAAAREELEVVGADCHIGSQLTSIEPFAEAAQRMVALVDRLEERGIRIRYLDMGGGLGIRYDDEEPPSPADYARALRRAAGGRDLTLIVEPGRSIAGNAGILLTRVLLHKGNDEKNFIVVDAAMNDLMRPALYGAFHAIVAVRQDTPAVRADVVGPICETGDFLARDRNVPAVEPGGLLAVLSAGAYGATMASNYNSRPRAPEVLVDGDRFHVVRRRETIGDLLACESIPPGLAR